MAAFSLVNWPHVPGSAGRPRAGGAQARLDFVAADLLRHSSHRDNAMRIWLWDLPGFCGVTDDAHCAMVRAQECMRDGDIARVELAVLASAYRRLSSDHIRIGTGWIGVQIAGIVDWIPFTAGAEPEDARLHAS